MVVNSIEYLSYALTNHHFHISTRM